jgi:hypothetical protein
VFIIPQDFQPTLERRLPSYEKPFTSLILSLYVSFFQITIIECMPVRVNSSSWHIYSKNLEVGYDIRFQDIVMIMKTRKKRVVTFGSSVLKIWCNIAQYKRVHVCVSAKSYTAHFNTFLESCYILCVRCWIKLSKIQY